MKMFDIHIDATVITPPFERFLIQECGFWRNDFCGHPEGTEAHEPPHHLTQQLETGKEFRELFDRVAAYAQQHRPMIGYVEGEYIALDVDLPDRKFDPRINIPFVAETGPISPGMFRESEIHVTVSRDKSDARFLQNMLAMGFFAAYLPKAAGIAEVFTVQGTRDQISRLIPAIHCYLKLAGGHSKCSIKEERVADFWLSAPDVHIPPVIKYVRWHGGEPPN